MTRSDASREPSASPPVRSAREPRWIFALQVASVAMIWVFVIGISVWILHLLRIAVRWHDVPGASLGISIVAIPVFLTGAAVLTYVFVGLRRGRVAEDAEEPSP